jgi:hypothetical protein
MRSSKTLRSAKTRRFAAGMQLIAAVAAACALTGCANFTDVRADNGDGSYNLSVVGVSYTMSMADLTTASHEKASAWCAGQGKDMQLRQQSRGWRPMQVDLNFRCLPREVGAVSKPMSLAAF